MNETWGMLGWVALVLLALAVPLMALVRLDRRLAAGTRQREASAMRQAGQGLEQWRRTNARLPGCRGEAGPSDTI